MTAQPQAGVSLADGSPARRLVDGLARIYHLVLVADHEARVHWVSDSWLAFCGGRSDLAGRDLRDAIPKLPRPEQSFSVLSEIRKRGFLLRHPVEMIDGDRSVQVELNLFPLAAQEEEPPMIVAIGRLPSPETAPPERHSILDSSAGAILAVDGEGFVTYANPAVAELVGIAIDEIEGSPVAVLTRGASDLVRLLAALDAPESAEIDFELERGGEDGIPVRAVLMPHRRTDGSGGGAVVSLRDLTPQRRAETELAHRNEELEHCVNSLAHDLRSPLVALLGFSRLLRQDYGAKLDDTGGHFLDRIEQAGRTMEELIHDLLELSRIGKPGERPAMVDPRAVLLQLAAELKSRMDTYGIQLRLPEDPPLVYCDRSRLYQVFSNLIGNAIDHMGDGADRSIVVEIAPQAGAHRITVRDFGRGIAPEHHERIFEVLQSLGPGRGDGRRTGMGLAIVRKIADTHNGRAWVESRPGEGAAFHVTIPVR